MTLTAVPDSSSTFGGWTGACSGTSTCQVTLAGQQYVAARFTPVGANTALTFYHTDTIGSVRALTNESGGTILRHDYGAFGEDTAAMTGDPLRFGGKELDPETALQNFEARYYRQTWGRFSAVDPVSGWTTDTQSWNRYAYARNNPLKYVDPDGLRYYVHVDGGESYTVSDEIFENSATWYPFVMVKDEGKFTAYSPDGITYTGTYEHFDECGGFCGAMQDFWYGRPADRGGSDGGGGDGGGGGSVTTGTYDCNAYCEMVQDAGDRAAPIIEVAGVLVTGLSVVANPAGNVGLTIKVVSGGSKTVGGFRLTATVARHLDDIVTKGPYKGELSRPYMTSPLLIQEIMNAKKAIPDPGGAAGALSWTVPGTFRGAKGNWNLVVQGDTILHLVFKK